MNSLFSITGSDPFFMTIRLLQEMSPINNCPTDMLIGIKPNLVCASPSSEGATTHVEIVDGIITYLKQIGYCNIVILESAWIGDSTKRAFDVCGYNALSEKHQVPLWDLKEDTAITSTVNGLAINLCERVKKINYLINVPLIKGHCQTKITCALKNMKGLIPDSEKRRFHTLGLHKPIATLNAIIKQDLIIADAICPDPFFEEGGSPKEMNQIIGTFDPVLMDSYAATLLGYRANDIKYITLAHKLKLGELYDSTTKMIFIDGSPNNFIPIQQIEKKYLNIINDADACSACYSNLVMALKKLDDEGLTENFSHNICIGQLFQNFVGEIGVGNCTSSFKHSLAGCPPTTDEMITFLRAVATQ